MTTEELLRTLTPNAAKLYLTFQSLQNPADPAALIRIPSSSLAKLTSLSSRACWRAILQLESLHLLQRLPRHYHDANSYRLLPLAHIAQPHPEQLPLTVSAKSTFLESKPVTPQSHVTAQSQPTPSTVPHQSQAPKTTPAHAPKNPTVTDQSRLLTQTQPPSHTPQFLPSEIHAMRTLLNFLPEKERRTILNAASALLKKEPAYAR